MWHEILYDSIAEAGPEKYRIHCMQRSKVIFSATSRLLRYFNRSSLNLIILGYLANLFFVSSNILWYSHARVSNPRSAPHLLYGIHVQDADREPAQATVAWFLAR